MFDFEDEPKASLPNLITGAFAVTCAIFIFTIIGYLVIQAGSWLLNSYL
jgi:hypothetical protein